jgi:GxxExxY protein
MDELLYKEDVFQLVGLCMEIHRELGKGHDESIYKDALVVELSRAGIPFVREKNYEITYKGVILPHYYYADFVVWDKILLEAKAVEKLTDSHIKQVLNYLAASKLRLDLLAEFRWRFAGVEKSSSMRHERRIPRSYTNLFESYQFVTIRVIRVSPPNSCNSCL